MKALFKKAQGAGTITFRIERDAELVKLRSAGRRTYDREIPELDWDRGVTTGDFARGIF